ncbi:hypothetical protein AKO1_012008 [Acrasis kona]|uniref:Uncharacterized protein n=1 Tax=Acrasis kona TaxID=1008807 RepID=A0AAW2Z989_9EUKA
MSSESNTSSSLTMSSTVHSVHTSEPLRTLSPESNTSSSLTMSSTVHSVHTGEPLRTPKSTTKEDLEELKRVLGNQIPLSPLSPQPPLGPSPHKSNTSSPQILERYSLSKSDVLKAIVYLEDATKEIQDNNVRLSAVLLEMRKANEEMRKANEEMRRASEEMGRANERAIEEMRKANEETRKANEETMKGLRNTFMFLGCASLSLIALLVFQNKK